MMLNYVEKKRIIQENKKKLINNSLKANNVQSITIKCSHFLTNTKNAQ